MTSIPGEPKWKEQLQITTVIARPQAVAIPWIEVCITNSTRKIYGIATGLRPSQ